MVTFTSRVVVPAPVAQTAAFVLDLTNDPTWRSEVVSMELDPPGPTRQGQRIVDRMRFGVIPFTVRAQAVEATPTSFELHARAPLMTMEIHRSVAPHPDGTEVTAGATVRLHGVLRLLGPLVAPVFRLTVGSDLARLPAAIAATGHRPQKWDHRRARDAEQPPQTEPGGSQGR